MSPFWVVLIVTVGTFFTILGIYGFINTYSKRHEYNRDERNDYWLFSALALGIGVILVWGGPHKYYDLLDVKQFQQQCEQAGGDYLNRHCYADLTEIIKN